MDILIIGNYGHIGADLEKSLTDRKQYVLKPKTGELDVLSELSVEGYFVKNRPSAVVLCNGWADNKVGTDIGDYNYKPNQSIAEILLKLCRAGNIPLVYIGTDVGPDPIAYEISQYKNSIVIHTSCLFGMGGDNIVRSFIIYSRTMDNASFDNSKIIHPTYTKDIAKLISDMLIKKEYGSYVLHNSGGCTEYELAVKLFSMMGSDAVLTPVGEIVFEDRRRTSLPSWEDAVERYINELKKSGFFSDTGINGLQSRGS